MADELAPNANGDTSAAGTEPGASSNGDPTLLGGQTPTTEPTKDGTDSDPAGEPAGKQTGEPASGPPEQYEDFKLPEDVAVDKALLDSVKADFKAAGYTQAQAQAAIDLHIKNAKAQQEAWVQTTTAWVDELKGDPEFGGPKFDQTVEAARLALRRFDTGGGMSRLLEDTRFGNNPETIKFLARVQYAMGEDEVHTSRSRDKGKEPPLAERLYGKDGMGPQTSTS